MGYFTQKNQQDIKGQSRFLKGLGFKRIYSIDNDPLYWRRINNPVLNLLKVFVRGEHIYIEFCDLNGFWHTNRRIPYSEKNLLKIIIELSHS